MEFKRAKDRDGTYEVDWSRLEEVLGTTPLRRPERIPFCSGDARVPSVPAEESMFTGVGEGDRITHAVFALRIGVVAVHQSFTPVAMRQLAAALIGMADLIDGAA